MELLTRLYQQSLASGHSILPPSAVSRWTKCSASPFLSMVCGKDEPTAAAKAGTEKHTILEAALKEFKETSSFTCADDDIAAMVFYIQDQANGAAVEAEQHVDIGQYFGLKKGYFAGTADAVCFDESTGTLQVFDAKFGRLYVPTDYLQLTCYLLGFMAKYEAEGKRVNRFIQHILQPTFDPPHRSIEFTWEELLAKQSEIQKATIKCLLAIEHYEQTEEVKGVHGLHCHWCKGKSLCPAFVEQTDFEVKKAKEVLMPKNARTIEELEAAYAAAKELEPIIEAIKDEFKTRLAAGEPSDRYEYTKLRAGTFKWNDNFSPEALAKEIGVDNSLLYESVLLTPAKMRKRWPLQHGIISAYHDTPEDVMTVKEIK